MSKPDAYLITVTDDSYLALYVFTDPAWAAWLASNEPSLGGSTSVALTAETMPPGAHAAAVAADKGDELPVLTSGSYTDDKIHALSRAATPVEVNEIGEYNIVDTFPTIVY